MTPAYTIKTNNIRLFVKNILLGCPVTASTEASEYPAAASLVTQRSVTWRSTSGTAATLHFDLSALSGIDRYMTGIAIINHNLFSGTFTIVAANDANRNVITYNQQFSGHEVVVPFGDKYFGDDAFGGYFTKTQIKEFFTDAVRICYFNQSIAPVHLFVDFAEPVGTGLSYIECGYVFAANVLTPDHNIMYNCKLEPKDLSKVTEMQGSGVQYVDVASKRCSITFEFQRLSDRQALWDIFYSQYVIGQRNPMVIDVFPSGSADQRAFWRRYVRLRTPQGISYPGYNKIGMTGSITFDECL
jgi:hypothetical protein